VTVQLVHLDDVELGTRQIQLLAGAVADVGDAERVLAAQVKSVLKAAEIEAIEDLGEWEVGAIAEVRILGHGFSLGVGSGRSALVRYSSRPVLERQVQITGGKTKGKLGRDASQNVREEPNP
jgi:hypothetical protein